MGRIMKLYAVATCLTVFLTGCSITRPVAVIGAKGQILRGTATASLTGSGTFSVTDGKLTCSGSYNALDQSLTIAMPVLCNDGRKGIITATRQLDGLNGSGRVRLTDGTEADFIFGDAAAAF
jgi:hypothetical protein